MSDEKQEGQKTVVAFIVGLLIGGLLVWVFSGTGTEAPATGDDGSAPEVTDDSGTPVTESEGSTDETSETIVPVPTLVVGEGNVTITNQTAGRVVKLTSVVFPTAEGWIGVRDYANGQLAGILGVVRYSEAQGLVPEEIVLQRPTEPGKQYAVVFFSESGDRVFGIADDVQIDRVFATFTAQ